MAGKPKKTKPTNPNWGGRRRNQTGRPKKEVPVPSEEQIAATLLAAKKKAEEQGKTVDDLLLDMIYREDIKDHNRIAAIRLFKDYTMPRKSEKKVEITNNRGPAIMLPERRPDPAKLKLIPKSES